MSDTPEPRSDDEAERDRTSAESHRANLLTLEICFLAVVGLVVLAAFLEALSYQLVSSRTPFVIMVPLFVLILIHAKRLFGVREKADFVHRLRLAAAGRVPGLNKVLGMVGWMVGLMVVIAGLGHYAGLLIGGFVLMRLMARESLRLSVAVTLAATVVIYCLFEIGFNVELYRGLLFRYFAGYRDF